MSQPRIAIVGGGPAGLTIGLLLHKRSVPFVIFELRQKPTEEELAKPSGMLDLHEESGLAAIKECGLYDEFLKLTGECTESQRVSDKDGNILYRDEGELSNRPEISRHALSRLLLSHLPTDSVKWGHKLLSTATSEATGNDNVELDFGSHGKHIFDLVIGADGTWSRVRKLMTDIKPQYMGSQLVTLTIRNITTKFPHLDQLVGSGSFSALGNRHGVMSQRGPQDSARLYVCLTTEDENFAATAGLEGQTAAAVKEKLLTDNALLGTWGPKMKELLEVACDEELADNPGAAADIRALYQLPIGSSWEHKAGVTIIGDAAHVMGPWAGEGVNLAMWDSLLLAQIIAAAYGAAAKDGKSLLSALEPQIKQFEVDMVERAKEKAEEALANSQMLFGENAAQAFVDFFLSHRPPEATDTAVDGRS